MSFQRLQATYRRLLEESATWKLLRADNAPLILAFMVDLFSNENEVPFGSARMALDAELQKCRELGIWETETSAGIYLHRWIKEGWLREMDDHLTKTDASEVAIRFCQGLDQRGVSTTASRLRIVQEAVRNFTVAISSDVRQRMAILKNQKAEIQREINDLKAGHITELSETRQREGIREIYHLAFGLTGDFRRVEDEIRKLDQDIRLQMIEEGAKRGSVLLSMLEEEDLLATTDAGGAFEGFYQLLCNQNRSTEFKEQIRNILQHLAARQLSPRQQMFLGKLMRELVRESDRVFQIRRRTVRSLRSYIESDAALENRAVERLLGQLERAASELTQGLIQKGRDLKRVNTGIILPVGPIKITSPEKMQLRPPDEKLGGEDIQEQKNFREPSEEMLDYLDTVQIKEVAKRTRDTLLEHGPMTIASVIERHPLHSGLEELVAYLRVAKAVSATCLEEREMVPVLDKDGVRLKASIPKYLLNVNLFPSHLDEMNW